MAAQQKYRSNENDTYVRKKIATSHDVTLNYD